MNSTEMKRTQWKDEQVPLNSRNLLDSLRVYSWVVPEIFVWGGQVATLIYLSRQLSHRHIHTLFYYIHNFLLDKLYIYTHQTTKKKEFCNFNQNYVW